MASRRSSRASRRAPERQNRPLRGAKAIGRFSTGEIPQLKRGRGGHLIERPALTAESVNVIPGYDAIATAGDCWFDAKAAAHAIGFIEGACRFSRGTWSGAPFVLQPFQVAIIANLYGWMRPDGTRRYRDSRWWMPRKTGKSELGAVLGLYHLLADDEPTPEVIGFAADRAQAKIILGRAKTMARLEPEIMSRVGIYQHRIIAPESEGVYIALSSDAPAAHGLHVSAAIGDELHAMGNSRELWEAIATAMGARRQPLLLGITTAGTSRESLEWDEYDYCCKVRDGLIENPYLLPVIYEAPIECDWRDPESWYRANPNLGVTVSERVYAEACKRAQEQPSFETAFRTLFLNQHVTADVRWIPMHAWDRCRAVVDPRKLKGLPCYLGIDLGEVSDLSSLVALWRDGDEFHVKHWSYAPEESAELRQRRHKVPYLDWSRRGHLTLTPGNVTDYAFLEAEVLRLAREHDVVMVGYDPANASGVGQRLEAAGLSVKRVPQSYLQMSGPTRRWEAAIMSGKLHHDGDPVLTWAMSNAIVEFDAAKNPRPSKRRSREKIDPVIAAIVAMAVALDEPDPVPSPYIDRGIEFLPE